MKRLWHNNSLSIVVMVIFLILVWAQSATGHRQYNHGQIEHGSETVTYWQYIGSGDFVESTFENWESEFLQMAAFVLMTVYLYQKGSAESKKLQGQEPQDRQPKRSVSGNAPWPVRRGGWVLKIYENSLGLAFGMLFVMSILLHAYGGAQATCEENLEHGDPQCPTTLQYMSTAKMWFESFQNWQSEFLALGTMVVFTIWLRQRGSPESKPVNTPHDETGA